MNQQLRTEQRRNLCRVSDSVGRAREQVSQSNRPAKPSRQEANGNIKRARDRAQNGSAQFGWGNAMSLVHALPLASPADGVSLCSDSASHILALYPLALGVTQTELTGAPHVGTQCPTRLEIY